LLCFFIKLCFCLVFREITGRKIFLRKGWSACILSGLTVRSFGRLAGRREGSLSTQTAGAGQGFGRALQSPDPRTQVIVFVRFFACKNFSQIWSAGFPSTLLRSFGGLVNSTSRSLGEGWLARIEY
jgi:hypothetical protein